MNQLKAGALLSYVSLGLSNLVGIFYTPFLIRMLGQSQYGLYALVISVVAYLTVLDLGFGNATIRYVAKFRSENNKEGEYALYGMLSILYLIIGLLAFSCGMILCFNVDRLFHRTMTVEELGQVRIMMFLLVFNVSMTLAFSMYRAVITAYEKFVFQRVITIIQVLLQPVVMIPVLLLGYKSVALVVVITALNMLYLGVNCWYCYKKLHIRVILKKYERAFFKEIGLYSFYVFFLIIVDRIYFSTGQFVLGMYQGASEVAVYAIGVQIVMYYIPMVSVVSSLLLPKMTMVEHSEVDKYQVASDLFKRYARLQFIIGLYVFVGFVLIGKEFILLWAGSNYETSYYIGVMIMASIFLGVIQNVGMTILQARNKQKVKSLVYFFIAIGNVVVTLWAAKHYSGMGCAVSFAIFYCLNTLFISIYYQKVIKLDVIGLWKSLFPFILPVLLTVSAVWLVDAYLEIGKVGSLIIKGSILTILFFVVSYSVCFNDYEKGIVHSVINKIRRR